MLDNLDQILAIFDNYVKVALPLTDFSEDGERRQNSVISRQSFFDLVLSDLKTFGFNEFEFIKQEHSGRTENLKRFQSSISINNFTIVAIERLFLKTLLSLEPDRNNWSHPAVFDILTITTAGQLRKVIGYDNTEKYRIVKLFVNMVFGNFLSGNIRFKHQFTRTDFNFHRDAILISFIRNFNIEDRVVCISFDEILISGDIDTLEFKYKYTTSKDITRLNAICHRFKINILP